MIAEPSFSVVVVAPSQREHADAVGAPGLGGPGGVVAEALCLLRERDRLERARARRGVPHVEPEAHRCDANADDDHRPAPRRRGARAPRPRPRVHGGARLSGGACVGPRGRGSGRARRALRGLVKEQGLWAPHLPPEAGGSNGSFLVYAHLNEEIGRSLLGAARLRLPGARRGQRRDPLAVRDGRAEGALAEAARRRGDPVVLLDDGARGVGLGSDDACARAPCATATSG